MRKVILISVAIMIAMSFVIVATAFAEDTKSCGKNYVFSGGDDEIKVITSRGTCAYIGIHMEDVDEKIIKKYKYPHETGVLVTEIADDSPAEEVALEEDDIIFMFDGEEVKDSEHLSKLVKMKEPGDKVQIVLYRGGKKKEIDLELGEKPQISYSVDYEEFGDYAKEMAKAAKQFGKSYAHVYRDVKTLKGRLGMVLKDLDEDLASYFKVEEDEGVLVLEVREDSPAEEAGIKSGDVIVRVVGKEISDVEDFMDEICELEGGEEVEIEIVRKGKKETFTLEIEEGLESLNIYKFKSLPFNRAFKIEVPEPIELDELKIHEMTKLKIKKELERLQEQLKELEERLKELEEEK